MTTAATSLLGLALPVTGELTGTWGDTVNNQITSLLDTAIAGTTTISSDADVTLTTTTLASNEARQAILRFTGARTAVRTVTAPAQSKVYTVINATTGGYSVQVVGVGPTTGVTIQAGEYVTIAWNGSDFVKVSNQNGAGVFTSVTDSGLTSGRVTYASAGGLLVDSANLTFNGTTLTANTLNLTNTLGTTYGGTGLTSFTSGGAVYATSTSALTTGTLPTTAGGTGLSSYTAGDIAYFATGTALSKLAIGSANTVMTSSGSAPQWSSSLNLTAATVGTLTVSGLTNFTSAAFEAGTISVTSASGTINYDVLTQTVLYYTSNASGNFTINIRGNSSNSLNSIMATGQVMTVAFMNQNGATAYYNNVVTIDGVGVTPKWQSGIAPTVGNASAIDIYIYTVIKTAASTYTVFASQTKFA
jgi:hypothetical protein